VGGGRGARWWIKQGVRVTPWKMMLR
jgi:hypothetical protein